MTNKKKRSKPTTAGLLAEGNINLKLRDWSRAERLFTKALTLDSTTEDAAEVYSARATCYVAQNEYDYALLDVHAAKKLRPHSSQLAAIAGDIYAALYEFLKAQSAYEEAETLASHENDSEAVTKSRQASKFVREKHRSEEARMRQVGEEKTSDHWSDKYKLKAIRGEHAPIGSAEESTGSSWLLCEQGSREIDATVSIQWTPRGQEITCSPSRGFFYIAKAAMVSREGFMLMPASDGDQRTMAAKISAKFGYETRTNKTESWTAYDPAKVMDVVKDIEERKKSGWGDGVTDGPKKALSDFILGAVVTGYLEFWQRQHEIAAKKLRFCLTLLSLGKQIWLDSGLDQDEGILSPEFSRGAKAMLITAILHANKKSKATEELNPFKRSEVEFLSKELLDECQSNAMPNSPAINYNAYHVNPIFYANYGLAEIYSSEASEEKKVRREGWLVLRDEEFCDKAAAAFEEVVKVLPQDHPERALCIYHIIFYRLRAGGLTPKEVFSRSAEAERGYAAPESWFGPSRNRAQESRLFVRRQCDALRSQIEGMNVTDRENFISTKTIKPIATVFMRHLRGQDQQQAALKRTETFWNSLKGDIRLLDPEP